MKRLVIALAVTLLCGSAYAQTSSPPTTGPAPQSDNMQKGAPGNMEKGSMTKKSSKKMKKSSNSTMPKE
jgi:hypothetical protein